MRKNHHQTQEGTHFHETKPSMKRRRLMHNYNQRGIYMITLVVEGREALLGRLVGNPLADKGANDAPRVELSPLGEVILKEEFPKISLFYPMVQTWKVCIMPDHIHFIISVEENLPEGKHLGMVIRGFKTGCSRAWWRLQDEGMMRGETRNTRPERAKFVSAVSGVFPPENPLRPLLFEKGYNDKILLRRGQLDNWKHYLDDNPRRLAVKRAHPDFFIVKRSVELFGQGMQMVGNSFLLNIPQKAAVVVHRAYSDAQFESLRQQWLALGEAGGVLVSAAIAPKEKQVMREAMNSGYSIILLRENGFPDCYKPSGESFDACASGQLLQIAPWEYHNDRQVISREQCLELNRLAERIAEGDAFLSG